MAASNPRYPMQCSYLSIERGKLRSNLTFTIFRCKLPFSETCIRQRKSMCDLSFEVDDAKPQISKRQKIGVHCDG